MADKGITAAAARVGKALYDLHRAWHAVTDKSPQEVAEKRFFTQGGYQKIDRLLRRGRSR